MSAIDSAAQEAVHAVAAKQEAVVPRHRLGGVVEPHLGLDAERAVKDGRPAGARFAHVVDGQAVQAVAAQPIGAGVADMQHVRDAPAQHQRREGASHPGQLGVTLPLRIDPAVERVENLGRGTPHFHGLGQVAKPIKKAAHRGFGRDAAALGAADAVGNRRHHVAARLRQLPAENGAGEILVALARPGLRRKTDACPDTGDPISHHRSSRLPQHAVGGADRG